MKHILFISLLSCILFASCKSNKIATNTPFKDDISIYRVKTVETDTIAINETNIEEIAKNDTLTYQVIDPKLALNYELDQASVLLAQRNQKVIEEQGILGYTIQVYSGTNRKIAEGIRDKLLLTYEEPTKRGYDRPNYKVKIGAFLSKTEAYDLYLLVREDYPQAFIVPELLKTDMSKYVIEEDKN